MGLGDSEMLSGSGQSRRFMDVACQDSLSNPQFRGVRRHAAFRKTSQPFSPHKCDDHKKKTRDSPFRDGLVAVTVSYARGIPRGPSPPVSLLPPPCPRNPRQSTGTT